MTDKIVSFDRKLTEEYLESLRAELGAEIHRVVKYDEYNNPYYSGYVTVKTINEIFDKHVLALRKTTQDKKDVDCGFSCCADGVSVPNREEAQP